MNLIPETADNVIALNADVEKELEIKRRLESEKKKCSGRHKHIIVDSERRIVECSDCGFVIDPFEYLERWASEGDRRMTGLHGIATRIKISNAEHADLLRKIKNLRSRLKRAGEPQPESERREFDSQRWNADYLPRVIK